MRVEVKLTGLDGVLKTLQSLPAEVVARNGGLVRSALRKGAVVILKQAQSNLRASTSTPGKDGENHGTGFLMKNLVVTRGKAPSSGKGERQLVRVRRAVYDRKGKKPTTTLQTAQLLEYGSSQQQAEPFLRPAFEAKAEEAIRTVETELVRAIERVVKKLAGANGVR